MHLFSTFFSSPQRKYIGLAIFYLLIGLLGFHQIFSFWFFRGWEASWFFGLTGGDYSIKNLMMSHGFVYYFNYLLFGWNPKGWFITAFIFHLSVTLLLFFFVKRLTKNSLIAFLTGLLFVITTAHHDVVTWGSFESLYAVQTIGFYVTFLCFSAFRKTEKKKWYIVALGTFFVSALLRESGLILIPLLFLYDCIFNPSYTFKNKKAFIDSLKRLVLSHLAFWIVGMLYLLVRISYGGSAHDFIDERVQFRILLFHEGRILEYIWYGLLAFGQYIPPYFIPYPVLNFIKAFLLTRFPSEIVRYYLFVISGWILYGGFVYVWYLQRKSKLNKVLLFCLFCFTVVTFFYSFAWTTKLSFLESPYSWSENRWRYLAFTFFAPFLSISLYSFYSFLAKRTGKRRTIKMLFILIITVSSLSNIFFLNVIQREMYIQNSLPQITFYKTFLSEFPTLSSDNKFYFYGSSPGLNDFLAELIFVRKEYYPNLVKVPHDWIRTDIYYQLQRLAEESTGKNKTYFIDYTSDTGVKNKTEEVLKYFSSQDEEKYDQSVIKKRNTTYSVTLKEGSPVEFPRIFTLDYQLFPERPSDGSKKPLSQRKVNALRYFTEDLLFTMQYAKIDVCDSMGYPGKPLSHIVPTNTLDGNIGFRSVWWANCRPAWITIDLGKEVDIAGVAWGSYNSKDAFPRDYMYEVSSDGKSWEQYMRIRNNTRNNGVDKFPSPVRTRYLRFQVVETSMRAMLMLNEITPITVASKDVFEEYDDQKQLFNDIYTLWSGISNEQFQELKGVFTPVWARVTWKTEPSNNVTLEERTIYIPLTADGQRRQQSFRLPESEYYSAGGQFISRFITSLSLTFPFDERVVLNELETAPLFK